LLHLLPFGIFYCYLVLFAIWYFLPFGIHICSVLVRCTINKSGKPGDHVVLKQMAVFGRSHCLPVSSAWRRVEMAFWKLMQTDHSDGLVTCNFGLFTSCNKLLLHKLKLNTFLVQAWCVSIKLAPQRFSALLTLYKCLLA
jgi:hypothetical protein